MTCNMWHGRDHEDLLPLLVRAAVVATKRRRGAGTYNAARSPPKNMAGRKRRPPLFLFHIKMVCHIVWMRSPERQNPASIKAAAT